MPAVLILLGVGISLVLLVYTALMRPLNVGWAYANMAAAAATGLAIATLAISRCRALLNAGAAPTKVAGSNALFMGLVWAWGTAALLAIYGSGVLAWKEWWHFLLGFGAIAALTLYFAWTLDKDSAAGRQDDGTLRIARILAIVQLVGMVVTMLGLLIDGKMVRFMVPRHTDWAANNVFFFGAMGIALISAYALRSNKHA